MKIKLLFFMCAVLLPLSAQQRTTFSFASDRNHDGPVFRFVHPGSVPNEVYIDYEDADLIVDKNGDTTGGLITFQSKMKLSMRLTEYLVVPWGPNFLHIWKAEGGFHFEHNIAGPGNELLFVDFRDAVLTSLSSRPDRTGGSMTLQVSEGPDGALRFTPQNMMVAAGISDHTLALKESFAFTLTNIISDDVDDNSTIPLSPSGEFHTRWTAEGSFSASAEEAPIGTN